MRTAPRPLRAALVTAVAVSLAAGGTLALSTAPAAAAPARYADDFNGDGYRDYAAPGWGEFTVTYGTAGGPGTVKKRFTQNSAGVPGTAGDAGGYADGFGEDLAAADLNRDGYADLAVADRSEKVGTKAGAGAVTIMWGARSGLGTRATRLKVTAVGDAGFGNELETGDFNGDGRPDLAVADGIDTISVYRGGFSTTGTTGPVTRHRPDITVTFEATGLVAGRVNKDNATDLYVLGQGYRNNRMTQDAWFLAGGSTVKRGRITTVNSSLPDYDPTGVIADFDKNGYGDLAVSDTRYGNGAGSVMVVRGTSAGPGTTYRLAQSTAGVATVAVAHEGFGEDLSAGDTNRDGYPDLAVSVPEEKVGSAAQAGGLHILRGGRQGLTGTGSQWITRATAGVPGNPTAYERFGFHVRLRDLDRDGDADLFAGPADAPASLLLKASAQGVSGASAQALPVAATFPQ
ncbi:FG-GAP and VCBS repeat-containing protein [Streptomyces sp. NPDC093094]|uniref:FG-GAP and VCBS repeat-containing protein n=1 Tax=Streptomyces sp. NPDC093094 TaxID=3366026 RepID=UPI00382CD011